MAKSRLKDVSLAIGCVVVIALMVAVIVYFKPPSEEGVQTRTQNQQPNTAKAVITNNITGNNQALSAEIALSEKAPKEPSKDNKDAKVWTEHVQNLVDAKFITEQERREKILAILKEYGNNPEIASYCIRVLAMKASIENVDDLLPYLKNKNSEVQRDTVDALVNHIVEFSLNLDNKDISETEKRQYSDRIGQINGELNALYYSPLSDSTTKQLIETRYAYASPSKNDILNMTHTIAQARNLNESGVIFIQQVLFTPNAPYQDILNTVKSMPMSDQKRIIGGIQDQLNLEEPDEMNISKEQWLQIKNFIANSQRNLT